MGREENLVTLVRDRLRLHQGTPSRRLAGALADLATTGTIAPGTRLPSERDLAQAVGLSRGTVAAAFNALCEEGLCERRHGSGTYVLGTPSFGGLLQGGQVLADLSTSVVPDPSHLTLPALDPADLMRSPSGHGYDAMGAPRLRALLHTPGRSPSSPNPPEETSTVPTTPDRNSAHPTASDGDSAGQVSAGPVPAGPMHAGPASAGSGSAGRDSSGSRTAGPGRASAGSGSAGLGTAGPGPVPAESVPAGPNSSRSNPSRSDFSRLRPSLLNSSGVGESSGPNTSPLNSPGAGSEILVTAGAQQGIDLSARVLLRPGDRVLVGDPTYGGALSVFRRAGAYAVPVDLTSPDAVREALARHHPTAVYVVSVENPTGRVPDLRHVAELAEAAEIPVIEDRTLAQLVYDGTPIPEPLAHVYPNGTVTVGSLSKVLWGGLRVGWLTAAEPLLARLVEAKLDADLATSAVSQRLAADLLERNPVGPWAAELTRRRDHFTAALTTHLPEWTWTRPQGGLSVWVRLPGTDTDRFAVLAREQGVAVAPGSLFSPDGRHRDRLRLSFALPPALLDEAVTALTRAWQSR